MPLVITPDETLLIASELTYDVRLRGADVLIHIQAQTGLQALRELLRITRDAITALELTLGERSENDMEESGNDHIVQ